MNIDIGSRLKQFRKEKGFSQEELCDALNKKYNTSINKGMVSKWENNKEQPRIEFIVNIADYFKVSPNELLGLNKQDPISPVTIGVVISAFIEGDTEKATIYANFIADKYRDAGMKRAESIIRKRIDGSYKNEGTVTLDGDNH